MKKLTLPLQELVIKQKGAKSIQLSTVSSLDNIPYLGIEAIEKDEIKQYADWYSTVHATEKDIFIVADGARNGLILKGKKGAVGSTLFCLTPLWIDNEYLYYFLKLNEIQRKDTRHIDNTFWNTPVPIISLKNQKQIAKNIKEALSVFEQQIEDAEIKLIQSLKSLVDVNSETLNNIQNLDDFKKSILGLAINGKLTENWRENSNISLNTWVKYDLKDIATLIMGLSPHGSSYNKQNKGIPLINGPSEFGVNPWSILTENDISQYTTSATKLCQKEDLLICVRGSTTGRTNIAGIEGCIGRGIAAIRAKEYQSFINLYFFDKKDEILQFASSGSSTFPAITFDYLNSINLSVPSQEEQTEIVRLVDVFFNIADGINTDYESEKLKQIELQKAVLSSFYENLSSNENIENILSEIELVKKETLLNIIDLRKNQRLFRDTLFKFGYMKKHEKDTVKAIIKDIILNEYPKTEIFTSREIEDIQEKTKLKSGDFDYDNFSIVFIEMAQEALRDEESPYFISIIHENKLAYKVKKNEASLT